MRHDGGVSSAVPAIHQSLFSAARSGDIVALEQALASGASIDAIDGLGDTALHHAVRHDRHAAVALLLNAGADPDLRNDADVTPLMMSVGSGSLGLAALLVARGAKPDRQVAIALQLTGSDEAAAAFEPIFAGTLDTPGVLAAVNESPAGFLAAFAASVSVDRYPCGAVRQLVELLTGADEQVRDAARGALISILRKGWDTSVLISELGRRAALADGPARTAALQWLTEAAKNGAPLMGAVAPLCRVLATGDAAARKGAALALGLGATNGAEIDAAFVTAESLLGGADPDVRYFVTRMLERAAQRGAAITGLAPTLKRIADDPVVDAETRTSAKQALAHWTTHHAP